MSAARRLEAQSRGWFAVAAVAALVLAGCAPSLADSGSADPLGAYGYAAHPCPDPLVEGLPIPPLGPEFECGTLTVPQNRAEPGRGSVTIPVARQRAQNPGTGMPPLLTLTGGPGGSGTLDATITYQGLDLNKNRDVIYIDQRGTLRATPFLPCPQVDAYMAESLARPYTDPATADGSHVAVAACAAALRAQGADLSSFNTIENAADVASLRLALGVQEWDVYGVSYGSDLALQYLRDYPEGIRAVVVDGVVPPQLNLAESLWPSAARGYAALAAACAAQAACNAMLPDLEATLTAAVAELDEHPLVAAVDGANGPVDVLVDGYKLAFVANAGALRPGGLVDVPAIIAAAATGDVAPAARVLAQTYPSTSVSIVGTGLTLGVFCGESAAHTSADRMFDAATAALPRFPADVLRLTPQLPWLVGDCAAWDIEASKDRGSEPPQSTIPVLLLSGSLDGVTPPANAEIAKSSLPNSVALTFPGAGHQVLTQSACGPAAVTEFLDAPSSSYRPECLDAVEVPPFSTG